MNPLNNRKALIIAAIAGVVILAGILFAVTSRRGGSNAVTTPSPKAERNYAGTQLLLDRGASNDIVEDYKFAAYTFKKDATLITIGNDVNHFHDGFNLDATDTLEFDITYDNKSTYTAQLIYNDYVSARLILTDPKTQQQVFDSGFVKVNLED